MYAKLINNQMVYPSREYVESGYVYCPPNEAQVVAMGFKPVVDHRPEQEPEVGCWWKAVYSESDVAVIVDYVAEEVDLPEGSSIG